MVTEFREFLGSFLRIHVPFLKAVENDVLGLIREFGRKLVLKFAVIRDAFHVLKLRSSFPRGNEVNEDKIESVF